MVAWKIPLAAPDLDGRELAYLTDCIRSGWISGQGPYVARFEEALAARCGVSFGVAASSGTNTLHLALLALEVGPGDEVLVPALSYVATANAVAYTGARPVFVDADPHTWNLDLDRVGALITPRTRAILAVHLYGHPLDMDFLLDLAADRGLSVIEDGSQALGAACRGRPVGGLGHVSCFSFYGNKVLTTGEGGMLLTRSPDLAEKARALRDQARQAEPYWHDQVGYSYRMTNLQAAVGLAQAERLDAMLAARWEVAGHYDRLLADVPGLDLYREPGWATSSPWLYSLLVEDSFGPSRDDLRDHLAKQGIETRPFFHPLPSLPPYAESAEYPVAARLARQGLSLPLSTRLQPEQVAWIVNTLREAAGVPTGREG